ncbi:MGMT family protein [Neolewinella lacunae]|uniref:MGMT family protein n=1 Tax=Neolewinella lacunae TaxID=1517758 RepID=A0A923T7U5_9BACT|nr:MGMT family protein [Neolewinella lacunae]MBC6993881.1 MGMT family protein [Neolewinella lacunae]MDN3637058.1 MGMT family protein [Neolewinella lacunae]
MAQYIQDVHDVARMIPPGRVTTYGAIADFLTLGSARMVGWAMRQCLAEDEVPAHRVVNRKGELSGRNNFATPTLMQERLEAEGVRVVNDQVVDFARHFWAPTELQL